MWKYQQIKGRALVWWKLKLSVVDEPMEKEECETLAKKKKTLQWADICERLSIKSFQTSEALGLCIVVKGRENELDEEEKNAGSVLGMSVNVV